MMDIISLKNQLIPGPLDLKSRHMVYLALYDLDSFRSQIKRNGLLDDFDIDKKFFDNAMEEDAALLELGMKWVEKVLFER